MENARGNREGEVDLLRRLGDELDLQAWLAGAEWRHPSLRHEEPRREVALLVQLRDELRLQIHLGRLEAGDAFDQLEPRWRRLKALAADAADDLSDELQETLRGIRDGYTKLLAKGQ